MKILKKVLRILLVVIVTAIGLLYLTGNKHIINGVTKTYFKGKSKPDIDDMEYFHRNIIAASGPLEWKKSDRYNTANTSQVFKDANSRLESVSYLVIHKDSILSEFYWEGYNKDTYTNSFSMAKSMIGLAIGVAIKEGEIKSVDQKASEFLPYLAEEEGANLTIKNLLQMTSGIDFGESYSSPFGYQAKCYYGDDLEGITKEYRVTKQPGELWFYQGGNTILLGMILQKATGKKMSAFFSEKVWSKIGAVNDAQWKLDKEDGMENFFSAFYSNPRDFARIGKVYLDGGYYYGREIVSKEYVEASLQPVLVEDVDGKLVDDYGYHWWLGEYHNKDLFSMRGIRGQYVIVIPEDDLIIVRMGHKRSKEKVDNVPLDQEIWIDEAYHILEQK